MASLTVMTCVILFYSIIKNLLHNQYGKHSECNSKPWSFVKQIIYYLGYYFFIHIFLFLFLWYFMFCFFLISSLFVFLYSLPYILASSLCWSILQGSQYFLVIVPRPTHQSPLHINGLWQRLQPLIILHFINCFISL